MGTYIYNFTIGKAQSSTIATPGQVKCDTVTFTQTTLAANGLPVGKKQLQCPYITRTYCTYTIHVHWLDNSPPSLAEYSMKTPRKAAYGDFQSLDNHFYRKLK